eukprot:CAMPEP_0168481592 /NCGR_PEP_ID=MMETSP0228-20121227/64593_1 /TAXON_ID=133427 /ORGANISM="Protoceratium reticulatum, Strain CCCM 535 (=CCMP 1889)" /LENGTH=46 /DNA_ID= /DNA_START= /DNA_END= /DNA_ORIENTATION=
MCVRQDTLEFIKLTSLLVLQMPVPLVHVISTAQTGFDAKRRLAKPA